MARHGQIYLCSGTFFHTLVELCISTYPSLLETNAPFLTKLLLLVESPGSQTLLSMLDLCCIDTGWQAGL